MLSVSAMKQIGSDRVPGGIAGVSEESATSVERSASCFVEGECVFVEDGASGGEEPSTICCIIFSHICAGEMHQEIYLHV